MRIGEVFTTNQLEIYPKIMSKLKEDGEYWDETFGVQTKTHLNAYYMYPFLFMKDSMGITDMDITDLAVAGINYYNYIIAFDRKIDNETKNDAWVLLYFSLRAQDSIICLNKLLGEHAEIYFKYMKKYTGEYIHAVALENSDEILNIEKYQVIARGKSAISKCFATAIALMSEQDSEIERIELFQDYFNEAYQTFDDFKDIKDDIKTGRKNWIISLLGKKTNGNVYEELYRSGNLKTIFEKIIYNCNKSIAISGEYPGWIKNVRYFMNKVNRIYKDITGNYLGIVFIDKHTDLNQKYKLVYEYLISTYGYTKFLETNHYMNFHKEDGYQGEPEQVGSVFGKTFLINLLTEISSDAMMQQMKEEWKGEIFTYRTKWFRFGWCYFPQLIELAPDVDTLSEIMRLFYNSSNDEVLEDYLLQCIQFVNDNCTKEDGSINTWMISEKNRNNIEEKAKKIADQKWKIRQDTEVTANYLYSLSFYKNKVKNYNKIVERGYAYILSKRSENGLWKSSWYNGDLYGTYVCMRFLINNNSNDLEITKLSKDILKCFNKSGIYIYSDNLNDYALAIIIIANVYQHIKDEPVTSKIITRAKECLPMAINNEGFCCANPFIKMGSIKQRGGLGDKQFEFTYDFTYESLLITTGLVYKSINLLLDY